MGWRLASHRAQRLHVCCIALLLVGAHIRCSCRLYSIGSRYARIVHSKSESRGSFMGLLNYAMVLQPPHLSSLPSQSSLAASVSTDTVHLKATSRSV